MVPLGKSTKCWLRPSADALHRSIALSHALLHKRPGLWGDVAEAPTSLLWIRDGDHGTWEVFAGGAAEPALAWLRRRAEGRSIALLAPPSWETTVRSLGDRVESQVIQSWHHFSLSIERATSLQVRRLTLNDGPAFEVAAPSWALRSWGKFRSLIDRGLAVGIPMSGGFVSLAWTYESDHAYDKIGVATLPRFRRLGLGRKVATTLLNQIVVDRLRLPVWVTIPTNMASITLARSLGFSNSTDEILLRWTPPRP